MTFRLRSLVAAAALAAVALPTLALARPHGPKHGGARLERAVEALELDEATRAEVLGVIDAARPVGRELRRSAWVARRELRALVAEAAGESAVLAQAEAVGALESEMRKHRLRTLLQVQALLTPEQAEGLREALRGPRCGREKGGEER